MIAEKSHNTVDERVTLKPGMHTWVVPWTLGRDRGRFVVLDTQPDITPAPRGVSCCLVLRTEQGWYVGGNIDQIGTKDAWSSSHREPADVVTVALLDTYLPQWREQFQPGWTPDPSPQTVADHLRAADTFATYVATSVGYSGVAARLMKMNSPEPSKSVDLALRIAEYHQRQAQLRLEALRHIPEDHPQRALEDDALAHYFGRLRDNPGR